MTLRCKILIETALKKNKTPLVFNWTFYSSHDSEAHCQEMVCERHFNLTIEGAVKKNIYIFDAFWFRPLALWHILYLVPSHLLPAHLSPRLAWPKAHMVSLGRR